VFSGCGQAVISPRAERPCGKMGLVAREGSVPVKINGVLPKPVDGMVRAVLRRALDSRPEAFVVQISWPHADIVVHVQQPFDKQLKFNNPAETDIARELYTTVTEIVEGELGPVPATNEPRS
jgi:hypothetical protein